MIAFLEVSVMCRGAMNRAPTDADLVGGRLVAPSVSASQQRGGWGETAAGNGGGGAWGAGGASPAPTAGLYTQSLAVGGSSLVARWSGRVRSIGLAVLLAALLVGQPAYGQVVS